MTRFALAALSLALILAPATPAAAHCQIPCGIYDDELRVRLIEEHITTVEKSMNQIVALGKASPIDHNQLVRWVNNKDEHAEKVQHIVWQYFMTQRIKPDAAKYNQKVTVLHKMVITAMTCKQTTDLGQVKTLRALLQEFEVLYFGHSHR